MSEFEQDSRSRSRSRSRVPASPTSSAEASVRRLRTLAPLPATSQLLLQMLSDPDLDMLRLAEIIEQTPALAARILGVANSAFFAHAMAVRDVPDAIIRVLGLHLVRDLSISFVLSQPFDLSDCPRFSPMRYWTSAMESAVLAQLIAPRLSGPDLPTPAEAYLGGLLHNLGLLALVHVAPQAMDSVFASVEREPQEPMRAQEQQVLGFDHALAGAELALAWKLPALLACAMGPLDAPTSSSRHLALLTILELSVQTRHCLRANADPLEHPGVLDACTELNLKSAALPKIITHWLTRSKEIAELAAAFLGAQR